VTVCFVDQNSVTLAELTRFLRPGEFRVVTESEVLAHKTDSPTPLVLVLDEKELAMGRWPFLQMLRARFRGARFLALGENCPQGQGWDLLRSVHGFVLYADAKRLLAPAVRSLAAGNWWLPRAALQNFAQSAAEREGSEKATCLTPREMQIVLLLMARPSNKEIAAALRISERTVKFHLSNIFNKLGVQDRRSAVERAESWHFLRPALAAA
jgi:DNA-binding NarL/FixJ family response regulator